jgi:hypothetical protein
MKIPVRFLDEAAFEDALWTGRLYNMFEDEL